jgi:hypothetical protein
MVEPGTGSRSCLPAPSARQVLGASTCSDVVSVFRYSRCLHASLHSADARGLDAADA